MRMRPRRARLAIVVLIVAAVTATVGATITVSLYRYAFEHHRGHLRDLAQARARLIAAAARLEAVDPPNEPGDADEAVLAEIRDLQSAAAEFGERGAFTVARRVGDTIEFIGSGPDGQPIGAVPFDAAAAEPMRRALGGSSGTIIAPDYRGVEVLAAYEWVPEPGVAVVAKMDLADVQAPLRRGALLGGGFAALLIAAGALLIFVLGERFTHELEAGQARYLALFEGSSDGLLVLRGERFEEANERACELAMRSREEIIGRTLADVSPPLQADGSPSDAAARARIEATLAAGPQSFDWRFERADGQLREAAITTTALELDGETQVLVTMLDVTERKRREEHRRRLLTIVEASADGVEMADAEGRIMYANATCRALLGLEPDQDLAGLRISDFSDPRDAEELLSTAAREGSWRGEVEVRRADGGMVPISQTVVVHRDETGEPAYYSTIMRDISARQRAEGELRRLATAIEQVSEGIMITDADGTIEYVNQAAEQITGYGREKLIGANPRLLRSGHQDEAFYAELWETISSGKRWQGQLVNRRADGTFYQEEMSISPVRAESGEIRSFVSVKRDMTEQILLESQMRQAQKMEAIGQLAGGVAHDFNNMLTGITGYAQLMLRGIEDEEDRADLQQILELSQRAAGLTHQLLAFSRRQQLERESLDLNNLVESTLKMLRRLIPEDVELEFAPAADLDNVMADSGQMVQVLMNMALNARDAMPDGGKILIATSNVSIDENYARQHLDVESGPYVLLSVTDTGTGMTSETMKHLFEPFFTTKGVGEGTGLGLATVYGIVTQHGGRITAYSELGRGSTFKIYLPATGIVARVADRDKLPLRRASRVATVLLVEDEDSVRAVVERTLGELGYNVLSADRPSAARAAFEQLEGAIDLLITDLVMPGGTGRELYEELAGGLPHLPVLFMSGYPDRGAVQLGGLPEGAEFLQKPFSPRTLGERVALILGNDP